MPNALTEPALGAMQDADAAVASRYGDLAPLILQHAHQVATDVWGYMRIGDGYPMCRRGVYQASLLGFVRDPEPELATIQTAFNAPSVYLLETCWPEHGDTCLRDNLGAPTGQCYDNCPAVHALEAIGLPGRPAPAYDGYLWMELGGSMPGTPAAKWLHLGPDDPYPCLRCLSRAAWMGVKALAWVNMDGERPEVRWCDVLAHAEYLMRRGEA